MAEKGTVRAPSKQTPTKHHVFQQNGDMLVVGSTCNRVHATRDDERQTVLLLLVLCYTCMMRKVYGERDCIRRIHSVWFDSPLQYSGTSLQNTTIKITETDKDVANDLPMLCYSRIRSPTDVPVRIDVLTEPKPRQSWIVADVTPGPVPD